LELQMMFGRLSRAVLAVAIGLSAAPTMTMAKPLGSVEGLPFFGQPYPYGYVYHRPPEHCIQIRRIEEPFLPPVTEVTWVCGDQPVSARY
jgi:hypothetical protein